MARSWTPCPHPSAKLLGLALIGLVVGAPAVWADPISWSTGLYGTGGYAGLEIDAPDPTYRNPNAAQPGTVDFNITVGRGHDPQQGIDGIAFNTNLRLSPAQFQFIPASWKITPNTVISGVGRFSWVAVSPSPYDTLLNFPPAGVAVTGLGSDATLAHFLQADIPTSASEPPFIFAAHLSLIPDNGRFPPLPGVWVAAYADQTPAAATPEPSTLALCCVGAGLLGFTRALRRRR